MKNLKHLVLFALVFSSLIPLRAQKKVEIEDVVYRRSSLHTMMLEPGEFLKRDIVVQAYDSAPFPDKYNNHDLGYSVIDPTKIELTAEQLKGLTIETEADKKGTMKLKVDDQAVNAVIQKYFVANDLAKAAVAKWFSRQEDGSFNMSMIHERGSYNASAMEAELAKGSVRGLASLKDAGEELIKNTFVVVNSMTFIENEPYVRAARDIAIAIAQEIDNTIASLSMEAAARVMYAAMKDGYTVWAVSYLYQLDWNEETANDFYENYWVSPGAIDSARVAKFDETNMFKFNYVGFEKAKSRVLVSAGKDEKTIISLATIRNIDRVYVKLQKFYDVFKTKTPIINDDPIEAKIGLKEGVSGGDKFDVMEMVWDKKTETTTYKKVGQVKVDGKYIWDNRFNMGEGTEGDDIVDDEEVAGAKKSKKSKGEPVTATRFKGAKVEKGMLLRQVK